MVQLLVFFNCLALGVELAKSTRLFICYDASTELGAIMWIDFMYFCIKSSIETQVKVSRL